MKKKIWYYEKWDGRHASFPPRRSVKLTIKTFVLILYPMFFLFFLGLGDFNSFDMRRPNELKKLQQKIRDEGWQLSLVDSQSAHSDEKDFNKLLSLHWFYLTEAPSLNKEY